MWRRAAVLVATVLGFGTVAGAARADTIRVQSTTDTVDAGLVDGLLRQAYQQAQPGDTLQYTGVGTGKALDNARAGLADVVITHAPSLEAQFVGDGFSLEPFGRAIFYSDYVVLGPRSDPAGVLGTAPHDAVSAFEAIASAGAAGRATFVSRGDNSGTNVQEQTIWGLTGDVVPKKQAYNAGMATNRFEPSGSGEGGYPNWYRITNKGQAASLQDADACATSDANPNGSCYTMVDRGTFNRLVNAGTVTNEEVVSDRNSPGTRGGETLLVNPFSAYVVNPARITTDPAPNVAAATRFVDFLTSPAFQQAVSGFPSASDPAFRPDAFAAVAAAPPTVGVAGSTISFGATVSDQLPGGGVVDGYPLQLQQSTDGGATYTDVGAPVTTNAAGQVLFSAPLTATTTYRVSLPRFETFSPAVQPLGVVAATPAPGASTGTTGVTPPTTTIPDTSAPRLSKATLTATRLSLTTTEAGTVRATFRRRTTRRVGGRTRVRYVTAKAVTVTARAAGRASRTFGALRAGTYRVTLRATDRAGNTRTRTVTLKVRAS